MNSKHTKRALLSSALALVLCFSMLLGTTFAWFTDSVSTGQNQIIAGNLDIELEYSMDLVNWNDAASATDVFVAPSGDSKGLWEPGHTEVAYLKITNAGTLSLKYQLQVSPFTETTGKNAAGEDIKLSEILKFVATEPSTTAPSAYTRETAQAAATNATNSVKLTEYTTNAVSMNPGEEQYIALVVYMPEEVGNEANYRGEAIPTIEFALNLYATQLEAEFDSFGNNYDAGAYLTTVYTAEELASAMANGESVKLGADITVDETLNIAADASVTLDLNGQTLSSGSALTADVVPVIDNRGTLKLINGTISAVDTTAVRNHGTSAKLTMDNMTISQKAAVNPEWQGTAVITSGGATTVINSGNYSGVSSAAIVATTGGHLIINGGTFTADVTTIRVDSWSNNSYLTINDGTFNVSVDGAKALYADGYEIVTINDGTFNGTIDSTYSAININGGTFTKSIKQSGGHQNYYNINGGTFVDNLSVSISNNTKVNGTVTDNGDGTYTVAITADDAKNLIAAGGNVTLVGTIDMGGETVAIPKGTTISGGTIENATLTVADENTASFKGVTFSDTVAVDAQGDGSLSFTNCEFNVNPQKLKGFSRGAAIIGANQYYTLDLNLEGCTFNYQYAAGINTDVFNAAIFMWSNVKSCTIKNCTFNDYGFMAVKLMNVVEGAEIVFEGNTFNMSKQGAANYYNNNAIQIVPQHDNAFTAKFINNTFNGDYEDGKIVAWIDGMSDLTLTKHTIIHSGNTINGAAVTDENFAINPV